MADMALRVSANQTLPTIPNSNIPSSFAIPLSVVRDLAAGGIPIGVNFCIMQMNAPGAGTLTVKIVVADNANLDAGIVLLSAMTLTHSEIPAGKTFYMPLCTQHAAMKKWLGLLYMTTGGSITGRITADFGYERKEFAAYENSK